MGQSSAKPRAKRTAVANGHRNMPKAIAVIVDRVKDENNDGAADVTDVALFLQLSGGPL